MWKKTHTIIPFILAVYMWISLPSVTNGLKCIDCTDVVFNGSSVGSVVQTALDAIPGIRTPNCGTATPSSNVKIVTCPENPTDQPDKVYSCGKYSGKLVVELPLNIARIPVYIQDRECVLVYNGLKQGCHSISNVPQDAATFQALFSKLDSIGAVKFQGDLCLTPSADPNTSGESGSLNDPGSAHLVSFSGSLMLITVIITCIM